MALVKLGPLWYLNACACVCVNRARALVFVHTWSIHTTRTCKSARARACSACACAQNAYTPSRPKVRDVELVCEDGRVYSTSLLLSLFSVTVSVALLQRAAAAGAGAGGAGGMVSLALSTKRNRISCRSVGLLLRSLCLPSLPQPTAPAAARARADGGDGGGRVSQDPGTWSEAKVEEMVEMIRAARLLQLAPHVCARIERCMQQRLCPDNVAKVMHLSVEWDVAPGRGRTKGAGKAQQSLRASCFEMAALHYSRVTSSDAYKQLPVDTKRLFAEFAAARGYAVMPHRGI